MRAVHQFWSRPVRLLSTALRTSLAFVCGCAFSGRGHEYDVTGEFRPDGSCAITVDGESLFGPNDDPRTWVDDGHVVCGRIAETGVPDVEQFSHVSVTLFKPSGARLEHGLYHIDDENPSADRRWRGRVAVWDRRLNANPKGLKGEFGRYYLLAVTGEFQLTNSDSTRTGGRFRVRARKQWSFGR